MLKKLSLTFWMLFLVFDLSHAGIAQKPDSADKNKDLSEVTISSRRFKQQSLQDLLSQISYIYEIPIGLEVEMNDLRVPVSFDFKGGKLPDLLNEIVKYCSDYSWEIKDGAVNVFPKDKYRDGLLKELLDTRISDFTVAENTNCDGFTRSLIETIEIDRILKANGMRFIEQDMSGFYIMTLGDKFTFKASDLTMKTILNKVVKKNPFADFWVIERANWDTQVLRLSVIAVDTNLPPEYRKIEFPDFDDDSDWWQLSN